LALLFLHSFLSGIALIFFETTANTMFLSHFDAAHIAYIYIATAFVAVLVGYNYSKLEERLDIKTLLKATMGFVVLIVTLFFIMLKLDNHQVATIAIMIFKEIIWIFISIEFALLSGMIFNIRQGKRLFGILVSGEIIAGIIGGVSIGWVLNFIDTEELLMVSIVAFSLSIVVLFQILAKFEDRLSSVEREEQASRHLFSLNNYYLLFFAFSALALLVFYFIDYIFLFSVEHHYHTPKELATFFGLFFAMLNVVNLFSSLFISGKMLSRFGVAFGLFIIPLISLVGATSLLMVTLASLGFAFILVVGLKVLSKVADQSILSPTYKILYHSIHPKYRSKVVLIRETMVEPLAMGLAGVLLLGLMLLNNMMIIYTFVIVFALVWLFLAKSLKAHYVASIEEMLAKREAVEDTLLLDSVAQKLFLKNLESDNEIEVIYSLDSLMKMEYHVAPSVVVKLMQHPSKRVRLYLLKYIEDIEMEHLIEHIEERIEREEDSEVLHQLLNVYCKIASVDAIELVSDYLHNEDPLVKEGAIIGMLNYSGVDGILVAGQVLNDLFGSSKKEENILALNILSKMTIPSFHDPLEEALRSGDSDLKRIAITAVGNLKIKKFIPYLLENLELTPYRNVSALALQRFGADLYHQMASYFEATPSLDIRFSLIKVFANMRREEAKTLLLEYAAKEPLLFDEIIYRLFESDFSCADEMRFIKLLEISVRYALYYMIVLELIDKEHYPNSYLVVEEIKDQRIASIFYLLGLSYSKTLMLQAKVNYFSKESNKQAYAIEVVDNIVSTQTKESVLPLLEELSLEKKLLSYDEAFIEKESSVYAFFVRVLTDSNVHTILRLSVIYEIGLNRDRDYLEYLQSLTKDEHFDTAQSAEWAINELKRG